MRPSPLRPVEGVPLEGHVRPTDARSRTAVGYALIAGHADQVGPTRHRSDMTTGYPLLTGHPELYRDLFTVYPFNVPANRNPPWSLGTRYLPPLGHTTDLNRQDPFVDWAPQPQHYHFAHQGPTHPHEVKFSLAMRNVAGPGLSAQNLQHFRALLSDDCWFLSYIFHAIPLPEYRTLLSQVLADLQLIAVTTALCSTTRKAPLINPEFRHCYRSWAQHIHTVETRVRQHKVVPIGRAPGKNLRLPTFGLGRGRRQQQQREAGGQ